MSGIYANYLNGFESVRIETGRVLTFPAQVNPRLENTADAALNEIELSPFGIHWPALDEDLSFEGIMRGDYGQR